MRRRRITLSVVVLTVAALLIVLALPSPKWPGPPRLRLVRIEPSGLFDENGQEARLVIFNIINNNPTNQPNSHANDFYVKRDGGAIEVKVKDRWLTMEASPPGLFADNNGMLGPNHKVESYIIVPADATCWRIELKYAASVERQSFKAIARSLASRLPVSIRSRIPSFWRWAGFPRTSPSSTWRNVNLELPLDAPPE